MTKLNRGELLVKAIKGEIKTGDKFKRVDTSDIVRFDGRRFGWTSGAIMEMQVYSPTELFEQHRAFTGKIKAICKAPQSFALYEKLDALAK